MSWMFLLTDIQGNVLGEVTNAMKRQVVLPLKSTPTCSFMIKTSHPLSQYFEDPNWDGMIKAYRNKLLKFCGPVVSSQEVGGQGAADGIQVNASGPFWRMNYRFAGVPVTNPGTVFPYSMGSQLAPVDLGAIAQNLVTTANNEGYTGIENGTLVASSSGAAGPYYLQPIGDAIVTLSTGASSFEWEVAPVEPTATAHGFPQIGTFNCLPLIGSVQSNVLFEYGVGQANVSSYSNAIDRQGLMTLGYITQPNVTDYSDVLVAEDTASSAARGRYLGVVDNGSVQFDNFRADILAQNVTVRKHARQIIGFVPRANAIYQPTVDYNVGDQVRCRVVKDGIWKFDAMFRIWGIQFDMTEEGNETPTLITVPS